MSRPSCVVRYGLPGYVGRFPHDWGAFAPGDAVIVNTPRGLEIGSVLSVGVFGIAVDGAIERAATADDARLEATLRETAERVRLTAEALADDRGIGVLFPDAEALFDGRTVILHAVPWTDADLDPLVEEIAARTGFVVRLLNVAGDAPPTDPAGCGKPGCGSAGGGCSTGGCSSGSCSRGSVPSADHLTAYFADLRQKMEADAARRTPLA